MGKQVCSCCTVVWSATTKTTLETSSSSSVTNGRVVTMKKSTHELKDLFGEPLTKERILFMVGTGVFWWIVIYIISKVGEAV